MFTHRNGATIIVIYTIWKSSIFAFYTKYCIGLLACSIKLAWNTVNSQHIIIEHRTMDHGPQSTLLLVERWREVENQFLHPKWKKTLCSFVLAYYISTSVYSILYAKPKRVLLPNSLSLSLFRCLILLCFTFWLASHSTQNRLRSPFHWIIIYYAFFAFIALQLKLKL